MTKIKRGEKYICDLCNKEEEGRFIGTMNKLHQPRGWIVGFTGEVHLCSYECYKKYLKNKEEKKEGD